MMLFGLRGDVHIVSLHLSVTAPVCHCTLSVYLVLRYNIGVTCSAFASGFRDCTKVRPVQLAQQKGDDNPC